MFGSYFIVENRDFVRKNGEFFKNTEDLKKAWNSVKVCKIRNLSKRVQNSEFVQTCAKIRNLSMQNSGFVQNSEFD